MTITEALAEIKTIAARVEKKREFVRQYLFHVQQLRDPLEKQGGSLEALRRELQAITDLHLRLEALRLAIQKSNEETEITVNGATKSVAGWLIWKREVAPIVQVFYRDLSNALHEVRKNPFAMRTKASEGPLKPEDLVVNINEQELVTNREQLETVLGQLDGQLSLKNATVQIQV